MKLRAALTAAVLGVSMAANAAQLVDPAEPPATPAGGNVTPPIDTATAAGVAIGLGVIIAVAAGGGGDNGGTATATATATGTN